MIYPLAIRGIGVAGGFGAGNDAALGAIEQQTGPNGTMQVETPHGPLDYPVYRADTALLREFVNPAKLRRINAYSRLAALAACLALKDAGYDTSAPISNMAVIVASGYGASATTFQFLDDVILQGDAFASPTQFSNSVHSSAASHITILLQIQGPCLTVTQFEMSTVAALMNAQTWLSEKRVDAVLLGGVDEINPVLLYCYHRFWSDQVPVKMEPLNYDLQTAIPGEGAAFMLLTRDEGSPPPYGYLNQVSWLNASGLTVPQDRIIISGADGHRACGLHYQRILRGVQHDKVKTFSQVVGSMPCGQIFDIALAAVAARRNLLPHGFCSLKTDLDQNAGLVYHENK